MDILIITLISILSVLSLVVFIFEIKYEKLWIRRNLISFSTFETYYPMFSYTVSKKKMYLFIGMITVSIIFSYILIVFETYNLYSILIIITMIFQLLTLYIHISRKTHNRSLDKFEEIYNLINYNKENRDKLETSIKKFEEKISTILDHSLKLTNLIEQAILANEAMDLSIHLVPLNEKLDVLKGLLSSYDSGVFDKFDDELKAYLKDQIEPTHFISAFQSNQKHNLNTIIDQTLKDINECYVEYIKRNIESCKFKSSDSLLILLNEIKNHQISLTDQTLLNILEFIDKNENSRKRILDKVLNISPLSNQILITSILVNNYTWLVDLLDFNTLTIETFTEFFSTIMNDDKYDLAYNILTKKHITNLQALEKILHNLKTTNETTSLFNSFILIHKQQKALYNPANEYEFKSFVIKDYAISVNDDKLLGFITEIIDNQTFDIYDSELDSYYSQILEAHEGLFNNSTKLLFMISNNKVIEKYININHTIKLNYELKHRLMFNDLKVLNFIICLVLLIEENKESNIPYLKDMIDETFRALNIDLDLSSLNIKSKGNAIEIMYHKGVNYNIEMYKNILSRIESSRLMYEQINQLIGVI